MQNYLANIYNTIIYIKWYCTSVVEILSLHNIIYYLSISAQEELPDLDEIERELKMLDEQILKMAESNNINAEAVLASTESTISTGGKFSSLSTAFNIIF